MTPDDADLIFALSSCPDVDGVYEIPAPPAGWPRLFIALSSDDGHALGVVTALIVRTLPHRDRSYIGVAATDCLRELWTLGAPLSLGPADRAAASARALAREQTYAQEPTPLRTRVQVEPEPLSIPARGPFHARAVWMLSDGKLVELELVRDPFRDEPPVLLVVTSDDERWEKLSRAAPRVMKTTRARSVRDAMDRVADARPARLVCDEALALGDEGLLEALERAQPALVERLEIVADEGTADWLASYLEARARKLEILEEPLEDDAIEKLVARVKKR